MPGPPARPGARGRGKPLPPRRSTRWPYPPNTRARSPPPRSPPGAGAPPWPGWSLPPSHPPQGVPDALVFPGEPRQAVAVLDHRQHVPRGRAVPGFAGATPFGERPTNAADQVTRPVLPERVRIHRLPPPSNPRLPRILTAPRPGWSRGRSPRNASGPQAPPAPRTGRARRLLLCRVSSYLGNSHRRSERSYSLSQVLCGGPEPPTWAPPAP